MRSLQFFASTLLLAAPFGTALDINLDNTQSISSAAKAIVENIISIYHGGNSTAIPGIFPTPYYWWNSGLAFDSLINYWALTGDDTYNDLVSEGMIFQIGDNKDYLPVNQTKSEGNDDQATWALAAMTAAEKGFPDPPAGSGVDSWLELAQNVFDEQAARWDTKTCDGGLRWQIFTFNNGYNYKNTMSNGDFMQLAARLFHYTSNQTFSDWATKVAAWSSDVGFVTDAGQVYDGADVTQNCKDVNKIQWTASLGTYLSANLYLYNASSSQDTKTAIGALYTNAVKTFANNDDDVLEESACASQSSCNVDQFSFRAILARALANAAALAPGLPAFGDLDSLISKSAEGAAGQCSGGRNGTVCGNDWTTTTWDGTQGLGQDLSALEIILATIPSAGVRTEDSNGTTGHTNGTGGSETSSSAAPQNTNGAGKQGVSMVMLAATAMFAYFACA